MAPKINKRAAIIGGGVIGAAFLLAGFAKPTPGTPECPPFKKISKKQLEEIVRDAVSGGMQGLERVASYAGSVLYPMDPVTKAPIEWPSDPPYVFPPDTNPHVLCMFNELKKLVSELDVPEEPEAPDSPAKIFNQFISTIPTPGKFFKVKSGWTAAGTGEKTLLWGALRQLSNALASSGSKRLAYLDCLTQSAWNRRLYGAPRRSNTWNDMYGFDTPDGKYWLWPAFMPWHEDAISKIVNGQMPERQMTPDADRIKGGAYGLLWLPPLDPDAAIANAVACNLTWPDGSSALEPPPQLLALLA